MPLTMTQTSAPAVEPVSLTDAKNHLRVDHTADDELIVALVQAAREHVETVTQHQLITATWVLRLDAFPGDDGVIRLPRPPVQSITTVQYVDTDGDTQTWDASNYVVDIYSKPGRLVPAYSVTWPSTRAVQNAVIVTYVSGYGVHPDHVPETVRAAIKLLIADMYEYREVHIPERMRDNQTLSRLLWGARLMEAH